MPSVHTGAVVPSRSSGLRAVLLATVIAGVVGYAIQGVVAGAVVPEDYLVFSIFWSTLYLLIAALSGLQQEATRATHPVDTRRAAGRLVPVGTGVALLVGAIVLGSAPLWSGAVFVRATWTLTGLLGLGAAAYSGLALLAGVFFGLRLWRGVAAMTIVDAVLRLLLVCGALVAGGGPVLLAAAVVLPFPLTLVLLWLLERRRVVGAYSFDVRPPAFAWNAVRAVGGSISMGLLTSGYPLIIGATSRNEPESLVGALVFVITLTRAPLVVPALALQSYVTVLFRDQRGGTRRTLVGVLAAVVTFGAMLALIAYLVEPWLLERIWGQTYVVSATTAAGILLTASLTAALCISGPATLAAKRHGTYLVGWAVAAGVSVLALLLPLDLETRVLVSMAVGPLLGILVHLVGLPARPTGTHGHA